MTTTNNVARAERWASWYTRTTGRRGMEVEHRDTPSRAHTHTHNSRDDVREERARDRESVERGKTRTRATRCARALLLLSTHPSLSLRSASYRVPLRVLRILSTSESWGTCPTLRPLCLVRGAAGPLDARTRVTRCAARLGSAGRALGRGRARNRNSGASSLGLAVAEMGSARERLVRPQGPAPPGPARRTPHWRSRPWLPCRPLLAPRSDHRRATR